MTLYERCEHCDGSGVIEHRGRLMYCRRCKGAGDIPVTVG